MKKRAIMSNRTRLASNSRRRQLLKRVHNKVIMRRQHFQVLEAEIEYTETC